ncbi:hypothetical protein HJC23_003198 [Cyclotella cryptica]|uniref:Uncharacterized protein n=1 Tax=Cyclotella cryptica TaxID=29204 RepID=A0ABD3NMG4_9STRA|eukprot:CCRYP_020441-RA/>CCRYP_020441-RA protein AED:0.03 eAED:0.03 QI:240/1/1/1/1/1/5/1885/618
MEEAEGNRWSHRYCMSFTTGTHQSTARPGKGHASSITKDLNNHEESLKAFITKIREDVVLCDLLKQRRSRWLEEEEDFAKFLVREFEHGIARDVENNSTLRAYLSRKLICTPMRVSKKFVGKKVGTIFYKGNVVLPHVAVISAQTHLELEKKCLSALVIAIDRSKEAEQKSAPPQVRFYTHQAEMPQSSQNVLKPIANQVPDQQCQFRTQQKVVYKQNVDLTTRSQGIPSISHQCRRDAAHINRSQNLSQYHPSRANNTNGKLEMPTTNDNTRSRLAARNDPGNAASYSGHNAIFSTAVSIQDPSIDTQSDGDSMIYQSINTKPVFDTTTGCDSNMIDLVSGFDEHTASLNVKQDITAVLESRPSSTTWPENSHFFDGTIGESPYITSKSFDELHQCLGKDIPHNPSHLDLNEPRSHTSGNPSALSVDSPYVTSKSFDEMHKCLGIGLSSCMSHIHLSNASMSNESPDVGSSEMLAFTDSNSTHDVCDPRSDRSLSAFSPFDANRAMRNHETAPSKIDKVIHRMTASDHAHRGFLSLQAGDKFDPSYIYQTHPSSNQIIQGFNMSVSYAPPFEHDLATFLHNNKYDSRYPQVVSTSASERSSDRGVNSSPDCADVQSD